MYYYEVLIADGRYQAEEPLTYMSEQQLPTGTVVAVVLRGRGATGFIKSKVKKPAFKTLEIKSVLSTVPLPPHVTKMAQWLKDYYASTLGDALKQFAPSRTIRRQPTAPTTHNQGQPLNKFRPTAEQTSAIASILDGKQTTYLLHGQTGSGKTYVYAELVNQACNQNKSSILLVPEIALTSQLAREISGRTKTEVVVFHSHLSASQRKKLWFKVLESQKPLVVIGPRSALFTPVQNLGLIIVDEAHEQTYKQEQAPRYHAVRVASKLAEFTGGSAVIGSATPNLVDYYLAESRGTIITMSAQAAGEPGKIKIKVVDLKDKSSFSRHPFLSADMLEAIGRSFKNNQQALVYLNRRGSARLIMCETCGWQMLCPNCDTPLTYHGDKHLAICHSCNFKKTPPGQCSDCSSPDIIYKSVGTKAIAEALAKFYPDKNVSRFDGDSADGDRFEQKYDDVVNGKVDIIVGTQIISKGLDLPKLGMVGMVLADSSLYMPDYTADEHTFQIIYQLLGRIGRGHSKNIPEAIIQTYSPSSQVISHAIKKDYRGFYELEVKHRQAYRFPPYSYLLKLICKRKTVAGAASASQNFYEELIANKLTDVQLIGPVPAFHYKKSGGYYMQIIAKSKNRKSLVDIAKSLPTGWSADLDPTNLL